MTAVTADRATPPRAAGGQGTLTGTGALVRFVLRRDRIRLSVWIGALALISVSQASSLQGIYASAGDRQLRAQVLANPAATAMSGPGFGFDDYTFGAMIANELLGFTSIFVALMSIFLVVRHSRAEEAAGRAELVRATVVGRHAPLAAVLIVAVAANVVLGVLVAAGLGGSGIEDVTWSGSWLFGAALASVGIVFAGVAAVTAQLTAHPRAASGTAGTLLGAAFAIRAAGDISRQGGGDGVLSWLSPIGWAQQTGAYTLDRWWPLLVSAVVAAVLLAAAAVLSTRRDVGAGFVAPRPGPPHASNALASTWGLALRQHRASLIGWPIALGVFGLGYGTLVAEVEGFADELDIMDEFLGASAGQALIDGFLALLVSLFAMVAAVFCVLAVTKAVNEESAGRVEPLLATGVSRIGWLASHLVIPLVAAPIILLVAAVAVGVTGAASLDDPGLVGDLAMAALVYAPVLWLVVGIGAALYGWAPRLVPATWVVVVYGVTIGMLAGVLDLPDWVVGLSLFEVVPRLPGGEVTVAPLIGLTLAAAALLALGAAGFRRRDVTTP